MKYYENRITSRNLDCAEKAVLPLLVEDLQEIHCIVSRNHKSILDCQNLRT